MPEVETGGKDGKVKARYNEVPGTFKLAFLYASCVITKAPDIMTSHHATSLYLKCCLSLLLCPKFPITQCQT